jgi:beta-N-acetylhexosaminidase
VRILAIAVSVALAGSLGACGSPDATPRASHTRENSTPTATPTPVDPIAEYADAHLKSMTLQQKVASLLMLHVPGTDGAALRAFVDQYGLGGLILMGDNIPASPDLLSQETAAISADPGLPVLIATDEEGGDVARLGWDTQPGADQLKSLPPAATHDAFAARAQLLRQGGINVNFGVIADTTSDPQSFIYDRVLGTDPASAAERVAAAVSAEHGTVMSTLKHFPGHGETEADSHLTVPTTAISMDEWTARDAPPFQAGVGAGAELVMFGHLVYSAVDAAPASLSARWHDILRDDLGFTGITITDDLRMLQDTGLAQYQNPSENAIAALKAGNTMLLFVTAADPAQDGIDPGQVIADIVAAVQAGRISLQQIDTDARKLLIARRTLAHGG